MKKVILILAIACFAFTACKKEEPIKSTIIKGVVIDSKTGAVVPNAKVYMVAYAYLKYRDIYKDIDLFEGDEDCHMWKEILTNEQGMFEYRIEYLPKEVYCGFYVETDTLVSMQQGVERGVENLLELEAKRIGCLKVHVEDTSNWVYKDVRFSTYSNYLSGATFFFRDKNIDSTVYLKVAKETEVKYFMHVKNWETHENILLNDTLFIPDQDTTELHIEI